MANSPQRVCLGVIGKPHGVRGLVRLRPFTAEPEAVASYGPLETEDGARRLTLMIVGHGSKGELVARIAGIADRTAAQALKGTRLFIPRDRLPPLDDAAEYYHADLIGLTAVMPDGTPFGTVQAVQNYGAGDLLEVGRPDGSTATLPFTEAVVPTVDLASGRIVVAPPTGLLDDGDADD